MSSDAEGAIKHERNRQRETVENILAEAHRRARIAHGATPPRPVPADEPADAEPADSEPPADAGPATDGGTSTDDQTVAAPAPRRRRHAASAAPADDAEPPAAADGAATPDSPADAGPLTNPFAARLAAAADTD